MEPVIRAIAIYFFLLFLIRVAGKRTLAEITTFDFVLLLIIGEAAQQGLTGDDFSVTNSALIIATLIILDIGFSLIKRKSGLLEKWVDGTPVVLINDGKVLKDALELTRVDESDILEAARRLRGIERIEQIKYAVLEKDGGITVIAKEERNPS